MDYIYISADYIEPNIKGMNDDFYNIIELLNLWNMKYQDIIPMPYEKRLKYKKKIEELDNEGEELCMKLLASIPGDAKLEYFSEGELRKLFWLEKKGNIIKKHLI